MNTKLDSKQSSNSFKNSNADIFSQSTNFDGNLRASLDKTLDPQNSYMVKKLNSHNDSEAIQNVKNHFYQQPIDVAHWDDRDVDLEILRRKNTTETALIAPLE